MTKTFRDLGVDPLLSDALAESGITHPFPIQELTLPLALEGHDLIGQARTGTGKTLAFGLPLLQRLDPSIKHTQALVIVPTRELCLQVYSDLQIGSARNLTSISVYGGVGYDEQIDALTAGAHVVVGTPGRLLDLLNRGVLDLSNVTQLVLDEADEMLDMGFLPDVERLVEACQGENRHTMLFSATMPTAIVKLARRYMDHPTFTRADHEQKNTAPLVTQYFFEVHRMDKPRLLARILQSKDRGGVYVFVRTKHMADRLVNDLEELHIPSIAIHGDLRQSTREKNLDRFRSGQATVLVCTEVAARGLDVTGVTHVINYDCPDDEKMYLHRIGRTARAGEAGVAITFAEFNEIDRLNVIRKAVGAVDNEVQQVFSTSKQLGEMFELPAERPWDHLTTKAGSDEARAARESRTDGRPKSGRSQEGRGGAHDARRSDRRTDGGKPSGRAKRGDAPAGRKADGAAVTSGSASETTSPKQGGSAGSDRGRGERARRQGGVTGSDTSGTATTAIGGSDRGSNRGPDRQLAGADVVPAEQSTSEKGTPEQGASAPTTRTRTRTRARSTGAAGRDSGRGSGRQSAREDADRSTRTPSASAPSTSGPSRSGASRSGASRSGASTSGASRSGASRSGPSTSGTSTSNTSSERSAEASESAHDDGGTAASRGGGRKRARGNQRASANGPQRNAETGTSAGEQRSDEAPRQAQGRSRGQSRGGGRSDGDSQRGERSNDSDRSKGSRRDQGRGGRSRGGGSRNDTRSGPSGRASSSDPTVKVAGRGEDARGDGQPQVARRVKVEHLP